MIVKAMPAVSHITAKNTPSPAAGSLDFSTTLEKKLAVPEKNSASPGHHASKPKPLHTEPEKEVEESDNTEILDISLAEDMAEISEMPQPVPPSSLVDLQLQHLQQLVAQVTQGATVVPALAATPPAAETVNDLIAEDAGEVLTDTNDSQGNERQTNALMQLNQSIHHNAPQVSLATLGSMQGTDNTAAQQHEAFLAQVNDTGKDQQENAVVPVKLEANTPLPLTSDNRLSLTPEVTLRPHVSLVSDAPTSQPTTATTSAMVLNQALGTPAWQQAVGQQLAYFSRNGIHNAELRLHPEELGSLQINLRLNNAQAQVHFVAENHQVRAALEAAMPHLRTSLAEAGINLGQSSVGADSSSSWGAFSQSEGSAKQHHFTDEGDERAQAAEESSEIHTKIVNYSNGINTFV
ncbi:flagellar hook-length control protein FliK [Yersinia frederiksenii]|nr:flagellar hook-length control protein FliK [Yersinia frederiksenii]